MNIITLDNLIRRALAEDIGFGDITSESIFNDEHYSEGVLIAKQDLVLAGMQVFARVFTLLDERVKVIAYYKDGASVQKGDKFAQVAGPTQSLLAGERVALNLLQRMSGIATETSRYVAAANGTNATIVDTRKTTPGLRMLEKYAVAKGGGKNHRFGLDHMVMIKDNHAKAAGGISAAIEKVRQYTSPFIRIEVEVENMEQVGEAIACGADIIMLDNMSLVTIQEAVKLIDRKAIVEVSGNVTLERVKELAEAGVDIISSGALTHSAKAADISMRLV